MVFHINLPHSAVIVSGVCIILWLLKVTHMCHYYCNLSNAHRNINLFSWILLYGASTDYIYVLDMEPHSLPIRSFFAWWVIDPPLIFVLFNIIVSRCVVYSWIQWKSPSLWSFSLVMNLRELYISFGLVISLWKLIFCDLGVAALFTLAVPFN
jgi:hypothetical protein